MSPIFEAIHRLTIAAHDMEQGLAACKKALYVQGSHRDEVSHGLAKKYMELGQETVDSTEMNEIDTIIKGIEQVSAQCHHKSRMFHRIKSQIMDLEQQRQKDSPNI